ncbi:MAG: DegT/DnrJ/EryC1/StrS aminotransferase family protein [Labilithrix sp.]|nr:DegT/DnrJ/EryC1/StrS aminotransferase family protein [Labilithrix sp.]
MQIVTFPPALVDWYAAAVRRLMESGKVAESRYYADAAKEYVRGRTSIPLASGGAAIYALLAYQKYARDKRVAIVQSNTMRALYTVPSLLDMKPLVVKSSYEDFMAMDPAALEQALMDPQTRRQAVVVYSVIGGYLARSFARIAEICRSAGVPLVVDAAHGHYLDGLVAESDVDIAYSFYATKILPAGEGGLVSTTSDAVSTWVRRFAMYDRFENQMSVGLNLRAGELGAALIHRLMTDASLVDHFKTARVEVASRLALICKKHGVRFLDPSRAADYNGYKLVVLDAHESVQKLGTELTEHPPTSPVFGTDVRGGPTALPHWCPPTYPSLR